MRIHATVVLLVGSGSFGLIAQGKRFVAVELNVSDHRTMALECFALYPLASHVFTQDNGPGVLTWSRADLFPAPWADSPELTRAEARAESAAADDAFMVDKCGGGA